MGLGSNAWQLDCTIALYAGYMVPGEAATADGGELPGDQPAVALVRV